MDCIFRFNLGPPGFEYLSNISIKARLVHSYVSPYAALRPWHHLPHEVYPPTPCNEYSRHSTLVPFVEVCFVSWERGLLLCEGTGHKETACEEADACLNGLLVFAS